MENQNANVLAPKVALVEPLAWIKNRPVMFLRDHFGGEVPLSCPYPPLELAYTAALLRQANIPVAILAANVQRMTHQEVVRWLMSRKPEWLLIPSAWGSIHSDLELLRLIREALPKTKCVVCGPNVTADPSLVLAGGEADFVICGEPEEAMLHLARGDAPESVNNLAWWDGSVQSTTRQLPSDWHAYPLPARDLLDLKQYKLPFSMHLPATTMVTARGCGHYCTFCPSQLWYGHKIRYRDLELVQAEFVELTTRYGMREITIRDDTFTDNPERVAAICEGLIKKQLGLTWRCFATVDTVSEELLKIMAAAGCVQVCFGFESGTDALLRQTGKGTTVAQGRDAIAWARKAGMEVAGTFLVGLEGETVETIEASYNFAVDNDIDYVQVNVATPMPGTGFGRRQLKKGLNAQPAQFRWYGEQSAETTNFGPMELAAHTRRFYRRYYFRPAYVAGRLRSKRGIRSLFQHGMLAWRMVLFLVERPQK